MAIDLSSDCKLFENMSRAFNQAEADHDPIQQLMIIKALQVRIDGLKEDLEDYARRLQPHAVQATIEACNGK